MSNPDGLRTQPRKRFGQHFLVDRSVIDAIVRAVAPAADDRLVEIGPGTGALTGPLLARTGHLTAIEIDRDLAPRLASRFGDALQIIRADVLTVDFAALGPIGTPLRVVGNLPYNISSPLLIHLTAFTSRIRDQHFMLQREVVERIVAQPGPDMGRLTVMLQNFYDIESLFQVPPAAFDPPPKVESAVLRMTPRPAPLTRAPALLRAVLASAYSQRRKMLRNTLGPWLQQNHPSFDADAAAAADPRLAPFTEPTHRAEEIAVVSWCALADRLGELAALAEPPVASPGR